MIEIFLKKYKWKKLSMEQLKENIYFTKNELNKLKELQETLVPVKILIKTLSSCNMNILQADFAIRLTIKELEKSWTCLSAKILNYLEKRYEKRKNSKLIALLNFFKNKKPQLPYLKVNSDFNSIIKEIKPIYNIMFYFHSTNKIKKDKDQQIDINVNNLDKIPNLQYKFESRKFAMSLKNAIDNSSSSETVCDTELVNDLTIIPKLDINV